MFSLERDLNCNAAGLGAKGAREVCVHFKVGCHFSTVVRDALDRNFILQTMNHGYGRGLYFKTFRSDPVKGYNNIRLVHMPHHNAKWLGAF